MDTTIFKYGELPEFKKFTSENIIKQFPLVLEKIAEDFKKIEKNLSNYLIQNNLNWENVINPINEVNEILRWSWGVISHLNAVNNSESLRDIYSKFLPEIISLSNKFGQSKVINNSLVKLKETNNFDQIKNRILDKEILEMQHRGISLKKIAEDFKNIEKNLSNYLINNNLNWDKVINPLNEVNEILRWSWGVISHLNAVNNSESLRDIYSKFLPEIISLSNKFGQSKIIYNSLVKLKETNNFDQIKNRILDKEILEMQHRGISPVSYTHLRAHETS